MTKLFWYHLSWASGSWCLAASAGAGLANSTVVSRHTIGEVGMEGSWGWGSGGGLRDPCSWIHFWACRLHMPLMTTTLWQSSNEHSLDGAPCDLHLPPLTATLVQPSCSHFFRGGLSKMWRSRRVSSSFWDETLWSENRTANQGIKWTYPCVEHLPPKVKKDWSCWIRIMKEIDVSQKITHAWYSITHPSLNSCHSQALDTFAFWLHEIHKHLLELYHFCNQQSCNFVYEACLSSWKSLFLDWVRTWFRTQNWGLWELGTEVFSSLLLCSVEITLDRWSLSLSL